ncbi:DUF5799 family protein [Halosimplex pelagicum]|uniref:Uncharacterized protein n=1 Tax=Halosimplex pelagicum TaxID=869886 RepID=A0A7D5P871_9EURY|nr:DUF5799 family protein [Halosimplex pelagicum]QLH83337.1 hypothetical protein HZS54_17605 [Halosimplex pelagicum]
MSDSEWSDRIVGERMQTDQEFAEKVAASNFSRQQWGLIMTAVEFEIENPDDPESARLVANTSKVESIVPELEKVDQASGMAAGGGRPEDDSGGILDGVRDALGLGGGSDGIDREQLAAAEEMAQMYAGDLQEKLESKGKWEEVCVLARE